MSSVRLSDRQRAACVYAAEEQSRLSRRGVEVTERPGEVWCYVHPRFADAYADAAFALAEAELTRLRAALASIAALQTEEPTHEDGLHGLGLWQAAEMARAALVSK